jgi:hypothetical protein
MLRGVVMLRDVVMRDVVLLRSIPDTFLSGTGICVQRAFGGLEEVGGTHSLWCEFRRPAKMCHV